MRRRTLISFVSLAAAVLLTLSAAEMPFIVYSAGEAADGNADAAAAEPAQEPAVKAEEQPVDPGPVIGIDAPPLPATRDELFSYPSTFTGKEIKHVTSGDVDGLRYLVSEDGSYAIICGYAGYLPDVQIPGELDGLPVLLIAAAAFENKEILSVNIPDSVQAVGVDAFAGCGLLQSVALGGGLAAIGDGAFSGCSMLRKISLNEGLVSIGTEAFSGCSMLRRLKLPSTLAALGYDCFNNCENLRLDVSDCPAGAEYAAQYSIPTSFTDAYGPYILAAVLTGAAAAAAALVLHVMKKRDAGSETGSK